MKVELTKQESNGIIARNQAIAEAESRLVMLKESQEYYIGTLASKYKQTTPVKMFDANKGVLEFEDKKKK